MKAVHWLRLQAEGLGKETKFCCAGYALMENRNGLIVSAVATRASSHADQLAALRAERPKPTTLGADTAANAKKIR